MHVISRFLRICRYKYFIPYKMQSSNNCSEASSVNLEDLKNLVYIDTIPYTVVTEGKAEVLFPSSHDVFYNPVQEFNRDLSIAVLKQFLKEPATLKQKKRHLKTVVPEEDANNKPLIRILEALAASGLRSIRFAKEVSGNLKIFANDRDTQAFTSIQRNIKHNKVEDIVKPLNEDASLLMYKNRQYKDKFDVIDLDPYGTAAPFLDAAVQSVKDGGLLMVTCTDMAVLCGNGVEACHAKYGAMSAKISSCHEMALRIVLQCIESHANRYGRYIEPLISLSVDFYVRLFVRVYTSPILVKQSVCKLSMVYMCPGCGSFFLQPLGTEITTDKGGNKYSPSIGPPVNMTCSICGCNHRVCGPIWSANMHNMEFVKKTLESVQEQPELYNTSKRILGMLNVILEELEDCPLFYKIEHLSRSVHVISPTNVQMRSAILNSGYRVSMSHTVPTSIKTDAPPNVIWDIMKTWAKLNPGKKTFEIEPSKTIMSTEPKIQVSFETHPDANPQSRTNHLLRFQINPAPNWGPKCRATTSLFKSKEEEKRLKHQNKRQRIGSNVTEESTNNTKKVKSEDQHLNNS